MSPPWSRLSSSKRSRLLFHPHVIQKGPTYLPICDDYFSLRQEIRPTTTRGTVRQSTYDSDPHPIVHSPTSVGDSVPEVAGGKTPLPLTNSV